MKRHQVRLTVSDHAVLRWLEREKGIDIDMIRDHIAGLAANAASLDAAFVKIGKVRLALAEDVNGGVIVTTALPEPGMPPRNLSAALRGRRRDG